MGFNGTLPDTTHFGFLPEGIHETTLDELESRFAINPRRQELMQSLKAFIDQAALLGRFSCIYIDGGFVTDKIQPEDIDIILQPFAKYGVEAFQAMEPFFAEGLDSYYVKYRVHLHFWCEGFPGGMSDFRRFFQYLRPQDAVPIGLKDTARKGIVRIAL